MRASETYVNLSRAWFLPTRARTATGAVKIDVGVLALCLLMVGSGCLSLTDALGAINARYALNHA